MTSVTSSASATAFVLPRIVIAAPASGSGTTTVATGLMAALVARGRTVAPFKVGPDHVDPGYHTLAAGRPGRNLDPILVGEHRIAPLFAHGAAGTDLAVIEGAMGLFDGRSGTAGQGSTAHVARLLNAPTVLVVDARGQGRSLAALLHGFRGYETDVRLAAVLLNQVGPARYEQVLREACAEIGLPVLGAVPRGADVALPSRHLGLIPAAEYGEPARQAVAAMAELMARSVDLAAVCQLADTAGPLTTTPWDPATEIHDARRENDPGTQSVTRTTVGRSVAGDDADLGGPSEVGTPGVAAGADRAAGARSGAGAAAGGRSSVGGRGAVGPEWPSVEGPVVAVAGGPAFTFGYAEHVELLGAAGARVVVFDPLRDESLPDGVTALLLPGGFPERHAAAFSQNPELRSFVARFARSGGIIQAEGGGLLYLLDRLSGFPMCGVLPATAELSGAFVLGYRDAVAAGDSVAHRTGERRTGHEFHRGHVITAVHEFADYEPAWYWRDDDGRPVREGFLHRNVHASSLHTHPAGAPETVLRLVTAAGSRASNH